MCGGVGPPRFSVAVCRGVGPAVIAVGVCVEVWVLLCLQ